MTARAFAMALEAGARGPKLAVRADSRGRRGELRLDEHRRRQHGAPRVVCGTTLGELLADARVLLGERLG